MFITTENVFAARQSNDMPVFTVQSANFLKHTAFAENEKNKKRKTLRQRLMLRRKILANGCWKWTGANCWTPNLKRDYPNNLIYGHIWVGVKVTTVHRAAWIAYRGKIPTGKQVLHKCDFPLCFNPRHLFLGTQKDNVRDMIKKGRTNNKTKAMGGFNPRWVIGEKNSCAILTDKAVCEIRSLYKPYSHDFNICALAKRFGVGKTLVCLVIRKERWKHVH